MFQPFLLGQRLWPACLLAVAMLLTACGGSSSSDTVGAPIDTPDPVPEPPEVVQPDPVVEPVMRSTLGNRNVPSQQKAVLDGDTPPWTSYTRDADFPGMVDLPALFISTSDGTQLFARVTLPADDSGQPVEGAFPVILTQTSYNASLGSFVNAIGGANEFLVRRGYASVVVDVRGTGNSGGRWEAFSEREQQDYGEVVDWVVSQPWSDGTVGVQGISYLGISALITAQQQHPAVKAAFPIVPIGDAYRDTVFTGGNVNPTFTPLWMTAVTGLGLLPLETLTIDPAHTLQTIPERLVSAALGFQVPTILQALIGTSDTAFDGDFWETRSPIERADRIQVPTFVVGGLYDIFQRSAPLWFEALKDEVPVKLLVGPWTHIGAAGIPDNGLPVDGVPDYDALQLQWFDQFLMGLDSGAEQMPNVTQFVIGKDTYHSTSDWPHPQMAPRALHLNGQDALADEVPTEAASATVLQQPLNGLCSFSTTQWTIGITGFIPLPCFSDNALSELPAAQFEFPVGDEGLYINGPMSANLWISSTARDAQVSVRLDIIDPDGNSQPLTNGLQTASMHSLDIERSRVMDGKLLQPWHHYRVDDRGLLDRGQPRFVAVELFPSSAWLAPGSTLRMSVNSSNFVQGLPPLTQLIDSVLGVMTVHMGPDTPSQLVLPVVPGAALD